MKTEENKRMLALACTVADLKTENMYLAQRVQELVDEYNDVVHQWNGNEKRKDKDQLKQELFETRKQCDNLVRENRELKFFAKGIHAFVKVKNIYMRKGTSCEYKQGNPPVCSTACLECESCLGVLGVHGVICDKILAAANVSLPDIG